MSGSVFLAVLFAAGLHAGWNVLVKKGLDKRVSMAAVVLGHVPFALASLLFVPLPAGPSVPYLFVGIGLHVVYQLVLLRSYEKGDLTLVYPIARGGAPMVVALVSLPLFGSVLSVPEWVGVLLIGSGVLSLALAGGGGREHDREAVGFAAVTAGVVAAYSLVDGLGARQAGTSLGFYSLLAIGNAALLALVMECGTPGLLARVHREARTTFLVGGAASFGAYAIAMWAFTRAPIALVAALRETSIVMAMLIGVAVLGERVGVGRVVSTLVTALGVLLLRIGSG